MSVTFITKKSPFIHDFGHIFFLFCVFGFGLNISSALEIRGGAFWLSSGSVESKRTAAAMTTYSDHDAQWNMGTNLELSAPLNWIPVRLILGVEYRKKTQNENFDILPHLLPVWIGAALGNRDEDAWISPYGLVRAGYPIPLSKDEVWWDDPWGLSLGIGAGLLFPYGIALDGWLDYMQKNKFYQPVGDGNSLTKISFKSTVIAVRLSWGIELLRERPWRARQRKTDLEDE